MFTSCSGCKSELADEGGRVHAVYGADSHGLATRLEVETIVMLDCRNNVFVCVYSVSTNKGTSQ